MAGGSDGDDDVISPLPRSVLCLHVCVCSFSCLHVCVFVYVCVRLFP